MIAELFSDKEKLMNMIKNDWLSAKDTFPDFLPETTDQLKSENEQYINSISAKLNKQIKSHPRFPFGHKKWRKKSLDLINDMLYNEEIIGMHHYLSNPQIDEFREELMQFMRKVREFAPELNIADIGQAIRNYIVYVMFKKIHNETSGFNPAAFGYSMLYPFTDNYIDNKALSSSDKKEYNQIIYSKIKGNKVNPTSLHQSKTCELLQMIEDLYPRTNEPHVYDLLLMMLDAQEISLSQQNKDCPLTPEERLDISVYKGGISVFMDRFFVNKAITKLDLIFYLGFGFFLQLADDLQDIKEDSLLGHSNLFTLDLSYKQEEKLVNKMLHYVHGIMNSYSAENNDFKNFLLSNCYQLIYSSLIRSREYFSDEYISQLENHFPITYSYWERLSKHNIENADLKLQAQYMNLLDELIKQM